MRRLLEDSQVPAELRADLLRTRAAGHDYPATAKLLQLRAAMSERTPQPIDALKSLPKRALLSGWKLGALLVLGGGAAFLAQTVIPSSTEPSPPPPAADSATKPALTASSAAPTEPAPTAPALAEDAPQTVEPATPPLHIDAAPRAKAAAPEASSSRREIAQLVRIRALLERDPASAHRLAEHSEREFPRGLLSEERRALTIVALAKMGSKQLAEQAARRYFARYPHSPMRELIEAALRR